MHIRRLIYLFFILLFLIIAPLMILRTVGYRYNWQKNKVERVGVLMIDVKPTDVSLSLNGTAVGTDRPLRLDNLPPNSYLIKAEKQDYFPWQKTLEIKSRESVLLYDIVLFKQSNPILLASGNLQSPVLSPKDNKLAYADNNEIKIYSPKEDKSKSLYQSPRSGQTISLAWSNNGNFLLVKESRDGQNQYTVLDVNDPQEIADVKQISSLNFDNLLWHPKENHLLYGLYENDFYKINLNLEKADKILDQVSGFNWHDNDLYFLRQQEDSVVVFHHAPLSWPGKWEEIKRLPLGQYQIVVSRSNYLTVLDSGQKSLYLIDLKNEKEPMLKLDGQKAIWGQGDKNNYLVYYNESEFWIFDPNTKKSNLISRYSSNLKEVLPLPQIPYYLLNANNVLRLTELDDRDERNTFQLFTGREITNLILDKKGENVYFLEKMGNKIGLFELSIQ